MKRLKMSTGASITFEKGYNRYLENCRQGNLREGTILHYKQSHVQFYKYFGHEMPIEQFTEDFYNEYVVYLRDTLTNDISINL